MSREGSFHLELMSTRQFPGKFNNLGKQAAGLKAQLHEAIFRATFNATDGNSMARQAAEYMLHAATYLTKLRKVEF